jgi:hypothetical protein
MSVVIREQRFERDGKPFVPFGTNYFEPGRGWNGWPPPVWWRHFDRERTRRHFGMLAELGANCVRVFTSWEAFMDGPDRMHATGLDQFGALLALGEEFGILIHPAGPLGCEREPAWAPLSRFADETTLRAQEYFFGAMGARFKDHPQIFAYDLLNEPYVVWDESVRRAWARWAREQHVPLVTPDQTPIEEPRLLGEGERFCALLHREWVRRLTEAYRASGSRTLLTCGYDQHTVALRRRYPNLSVPDGVGLLDFVSVHFYPQAPVLARADFEFWQTLGQLVLRHYAGFGKPVVLGEFGCPGGNTTTVDWWGLGYKDPPTPESLSADFSAALVERSAGLCSGWLCWGMFDTPEATDVTQRSGLFRADGTLKPWGEAFRRLAERVGAWPAPSAPGLVHLVDRGGDVPDLHVLDGWTSGGRMRASAYVVQLGT